MLGGGESVDTVLGQTDVSELIWGIRAGEVLGMERRPSALIVG